MNNEIETHDNVISKILPITILLVALFLAVGYLFKNSNPETTNTALPPQIDKFEPLKNECTQFEYSNWQSCSEDGKQYRTITKMLPFACSGGNPIQSQDCEYRPIVAEPVVVESAPEILARIITQIRNAKNQTIYSSYVSGANGELLQKLSYLILDNSLVVRSTIVHRDTGIAEPTVDFIDNNLDGFIDFFANSDRIPHTIDKNEYSQMQVIFGVYLANFASNHLDK